MKIARTFAGAIALLTVIILTASCAGEKVSPPAPVPTPVPAPSPAPVPPPTPLPPSLPPNPALQGELKVIGSLNVSAGPENITDLWAHTASNGKSYAYLGTYDQPFCRADISGVHVIDISDPASPQKVGLIPSPAGTRVSDVMVQSIKTAFFSGDIMVFSIENCRGTTQPAAKGIVIYDVSDPLKPRLLAENFMNFEVHTIFVYQQGERVFVLVTQDAGTRDFHIVEITNPTTPVEVSARGDVDWFDPAKDQLALGAFPAAFLHDMSAQVYPSDFPDAKLAGKTIAYLAYWDAGLVILDITDPANPVFLGDSDYLSPDPLTGLPPEGNAHSAVPTADGKLVFLGDEDFSDFRTIFSIDTGNFAGEYRTVQANFSQRLSEIEGKKLSGETMFIGEACNASEIPPPSKDKQFIALIERGVCPFDQKVSNAAAAGYAGAIVFASADAPDQLVPMDGSQDKGTIPAFFVSPSTAFAILGLSPTSPPATSLPPIGTQGQQVTIRVLFDGWGYGRLLDVSDSKNIIELGQYASPEALLDPPPPGDHSIHNVMVKEGKAYISWYADGIQVVDFSNPRRPSEIASFVDKERGSNFWGVYLFEHPNGNTYILGSDRTTGLWILQLI